MILTIEKCVDDLKWDNFISMSPHSSIYLTSRILNQSFNQFDKLFFFDQNKMIIASAIIKKDKKYNDYTEYQGLALSKPNGSNTIQKIVTDQFKKTETVLNLLEKKYKTFNLSLHPNITDLRPFQWLNYHNTKKKISFSLKYTAIIDLKDYIDFEHYLSSIRSVRRQEYKKAIRNKLRFIESNEIEDFLRLYILTFARQGLSVSQYDLNYICNVYKTLSEIGQAKLTYVINENNTIISGMIVYLYKDTMYYQFGATDPEYRNTGGFVFAMLNNIKYGIENGINKFDMVGINSPNRGDFKISFNAKPISYYHVSY